jgi:hypothetical protein
MSRLVFGALVALLVACDQASVPRPIVPPATGGAPAHEAPAPKRRGEGEMVTVFQHQAALARPLVRTPLANRFLDAASALPPIRTRVVYHDAEKTHFYTSATAAALPADARAKLTKREVDEERYYDADVNDLLAYTRPLEIVASLGVDLRAGSKVLDFGYGSIGHLRMLASLGVDARGVDVYPALPAYYSEPGDTGVVPGLAGGPAGSLRLYHGVFPVDAKLVTEVGGGYDFVIAKNVLKKGYIHPDRPTDEKWLIHLGVDDATFLRTFHDTLRARGSMLVYNVFTPIPADQPFKPMSDGRCAFTREQWEAAGFVVRVFDRDDAEGIRQLLGTLALDDAERAETKTYEALYTLVQRD